VQRCCREPRPPVAGTPDHRHGPHRAPRRVGAPHPRACARGGRPRPPRFATCHGRSWPAVRCHPERVPARRDESNGSRRAAQRPARPPVSPQTLKHRLVVLDRQEGPPVGHLGRQRSAGVDQRVAPPLDVRPGAGPRPLPRPRHEARPDRVPLDVSHRRHGMRPVQHAREEPLLPQVPSPSFTEVDAAGVPPMGLADAAGQALGRLGHCHEVHVIRHQAPRPDRHAAGGAPFGHEGEVRLVVVITEEGG